MCGVADTDLALVGQVRPSAAQGIDSRLCGTGIRIKKNYIATGLCSHLRNTAAHGTGADDGNLLKKWR